MFERDREAALELGFGQQSKHPLPLQHEPELVPERVTDTAHVTGGACPAFLVLGRVAFLPDITGVFLLGSRLLVRGLRSVGATLMLADLSLEDFSFQLEPRADERRYSSVPGSCCPSALAGSKEGSASVAGVTGS